MLKILPALEGYVLANIATQNLFGGNPLEFLLGDLNTSAPANGNALTMAMGPQVGIITLKELLTGSMNVTTKTATGKVMGKTMYKYGTGQAGGVYEAVSESFMDNFGNIIVGTALSTAGFKIAKKVLRKPINMANRTLRQFNLGSTVQF